MINNVLFLLATLPAPLIILFIGVSFWKSPPAPSESFGYRTKRSQQSEQAWYFAQISYGKYSTIVFAVLLAVTLAVETLGIIINFDENLGFAVFIVLNAAVVGALFALIAVIEHKLKKLFG